MTERESMFRGWQKAQWLAKAECPECPEMNSSFRKQQIELFESGEAYCNTCSAKWRPSLQDIRGESKRVI